MHNGHGLVSFMVMWSSFIGWGRSCFLQSAPQKEKMVSGQKPPSPTPPNKTPNDDL